MTNNQQKEPKMRKPLSLFLTIVLLLSTICLGATAVETETVAKNAGSSVERISFSSNELTEQLGIKEILLPEGFKLEVYVYYSKVDCDCEFPEYLTIVFSDDSQTDVPIKQWVGYDYVGYFSLYNEKNVRIGYKYDYLRENYVWSAYISIKETTVSKECVENKQPFSANLSRYFKDNYNHFKALWTYAYGVPVGYNDSYSYDIINFFNNLADRTVFLIRSIFEQ